MSEERLETGSRHRTVLGADCRISGELCLDNDAVIMGRFEGTLRVSGMLELTATSQVRGTVIAGTLRLAGKVEGDVIAEEGVDLLAGSALCGELFTARVNVEEGALFQGQVCVSPNAMDAAAERLESLAAAGHEVPPRQVDEAAMAANQAAGLEVPRQQAPTERAQVHTVAHAMSDAIQRRRAKVLGSARRVAAAFNGDAS